MIVPIGLANSGELPVPGDYDGSGRTEAAVYSSTGGFIQYEPATGGPIVTVLVGAANNGSIPVLPTVLPIFTGQGASSGSGQGIRAETTVPSSPPSNSSGSTNTISVSASSAVPAGPTLASVRVARGLINQATSDPFKLT